MERREFIKNAVSFAAFTALAACTKKEEVKPKDSSPASEPTGSVPADQSTPSAEQPKIDLPASEMVSENDPMAKALKYVADAEKADPAIRKEKLGVAGTDQLCSNCNFYKPEADKAYGKCTLIPKGYVPEDAWCFSWVPVASS